jgi:signal peptidase I
MVVDSNNYVMPPYERNVKSKSRFVLVGQRVAKSITWGVLGVLCLFSIALGTTLAQARVVLTDSMSPAIRPGDVIIATKPNFVAPEIGKVVIYTGKRFNGTIVGSFSHRIIGGDASNGFIVKGDKNESADVQRPGISDIEGVVLFTIPFLGLLLTPQNLTLLLFCGFGFWLIYDAFRMSKR